MMEVTPEIDRALRRAHLDSVTIVAGLPSVAPTLKMPPYRFQEPDFGSGSIGSKVKP